MTRFPRIRRALGRTPSAPAIFAIIVGSALVGTLLRLAISQVSPTLPYVSYYPTVLICTLLAGGRAGTICALLSGLLAVELFSPEHAVGLLSDRALLGGLLAFFASTAVIILTASTLRRTVSELDDAVRLASRLNQELQHRVGNTLAVVQAVARQTAKGRSTEEFLPIFEERMRALARANRYLGTGSGLVCDVGTLLAEGCGAFLDAGNITMDGPDCRVPGDSCVPLIMALHELCTNAVKYGALSEPEGRVSVTWAMVGDGDELLVTWQETGGPPVSQPTRKGLGSAVLRAQKGLADVTLHFEPAGLRCEIRIEGVTVDG